MMTFIFPSGFNVLGTVLSTPYMGASSNSQCRHAGVRNVSTEHRVFMSGDKLTFTQIDACEYHAAMSHLAYIWVATEMLGFHLQEMIRGARGLASKQNISYLMQ